MGRFLIDWSLPIAAVVLVVTAWCVLPSTPTARADEATLTLIELDRRAERRHHELLIRIESLRRQTLTLHGKRWVEEKEDP